MNRSPVQSSHIKSIGHEGTVLEIEYANGDIYRFDNVSDDSFSGIESAKSVGKAVNFVIKQDGVTGEKVEKPIVELAE